MSQPLDKPVQFLKGVGPARAADFIKVGVETVRDLIFTFPRDLSDRSTFRTIADAPVGEEVALIVRPTDVRQKKLRGGRLNLTVVRFADDTGEMEAVWFNSPWVLDKFTGQRVMLYGKAKTDFGLLKMEHPQYELLEESAESGLHIGRIVPVYPCAGKLNQTAWRKVMELALETHLPDLEELLPPSRLREMDLPDRQTAVRDMHFPPDKQASERARARLVYDECLLMQTGILLARRHERTGLPGRQFPVTPALDRRIRALFPFHLTPAQDAALAEILKDMAAPEPMHRLLQGDVGSGKTAVALYAMLVAVAAGAQVCLMAPTSLLARQHHETIEKFLASSAKSRVRAALLAGGAKPKEREILCAELASGAVDILVATHAAVQEDVRFRDLGLVVIDEQHKFGVRQRATLVGKGRRPDTLVMTATPIPRSLALTVYGDLDVSVITGLPPGRKPVKTIVPDKTREAAMWQYVRRELAMGRQVFVVSPLVEESEELEVTSATEAFEQLKAGELRDYRLALLHGRMSRDEQRSIMDAFRKGETDVLISTVVIEVGVDIPNATIMIVLHAERFGLAQLHQLRGRIGRGAHAGVFVLLSDARTEDAQRRLAALEATSDGFRIAEEDLALRGPGEFLGRRQHGMPDLKLVDLAKDLDTIRRARRDAEVLLDEDPSLDQPAHRALRTELARLMGERWQEVGIG